MYVLFYFLCYLECLFCNSSKYRFICPKIFRCNIKIHLVYSGSFRWTFASWFFGYCWSIIMNIPANHCALILVFHSLPTYLANSAASCSKTLTFWAYPNYSPNIYVPIINIPRSQFLHTLAKPYFPHKFIVLSEVAFNHNFGLKLLAIYYDNKFSCAINYCYFVERLFFMLNYKAH